MDRIGVRGTVGVAGWRRAAWATLVVAAVLALLGASAAQAAQSGDAVAWGANGSGQLGDGSMLQSNKPVAVSGLTQVVAVGSGGAHSLALLADGTLWAWGDNTWGQLGDNSTQQSSVPVQVTGLTGLTITAIAVGNNHNLVLTSDGTVYAWGDNNYGKIGQGVVSGKYLTPEQVKASAAASDYLTDVVAIAAGFGHSVALKSDASVWAWGRNSDGELGNNDKPNSSAYPSQVKDSPTTDLMDVTAVAVGAYHCFAMKAGGGVWAWGDNAQGQLGDGSNVDRAVAGQIAAWTGVTSIVGGELHTLALKPDSTVLACGDNYYRQLGDSTGTDHWTPVQVWAPGGSGFLSGVSAVSGGRRHSVALKSDGTVFSWGNNSFGQLGNPAITYYSALPVQVVHPTDPGEYLASVAAVGAGWYHNLAIVSLNAPPEAQPDAYVVDEDGILDVAAPGVLDNDADPDEDPLDAVLVDDVDSGSLTLNSNGSFTYWPSLDFNGTDSFTYQAFDGELYSEEVTVTITVTSVNDAPEAECDGPYLSATGFALKLDASASYDVEGAALTYKWTLGDGSTLTTAEPIAYYTYWSAGTYDITLVVNDGEVDSPEYTTSATVEDGGTGQRPDIDHFLTFANPTARKSTVADTSFEVHIFYGPTIDASTLKVTLNKQNISALFDPTENPTDETVTITLTAGKKNHLVFEVDGTRDDGKTATDKDRFQITVP